MNLAVIISVSEYQYASALPGCKLDAQHMQHMLQLTGRFDDILVLDQSPSTPDMRTHLNDWVKRNKGQLVDEVFWYFTGHGIYYGDARFCGRDYSPQLLEATSLSNQEVDDLLRLLQPRVVVKVIDACQSGAPYIKGHPPAFRRALEHSRLESFISMCSCTREQSSYAHLFGSDFTLTWLEAVLQRRSGVVSYRQIEQHDSTISAPGGADAVFRQAGDGPRNVLPYQPAHANPGTHHPSRSPGQTCHDQSI